MPCKCNQVKFPLSNKGDKHLKRKPRKRANDFKRNKNKNEITTVQAITVVERKQAKNSLK